MTVRELIAKLSQLDQDRVVMWQEGCTLCYVQELYEEEKADGEVVVVIG